MTSAEGKRFAMLKDHDGKAPEFDVTCRISILICDRKGSNRRRARVRRNVADGIRHWRRRGYTR